MAIIDLMNLEPTTISKDLRSKYLLLYSLPKAGKTSFAVQIPDSILFAFERGYNALSGIHAVDIDKWSDAKALLRQLNKQEVRDKFKVVIIDTLSIAWEACEKYICQMNDAETIGDIPWGGGYALLQKEFSDFLRQIVMMDYGLIILTHAKIGTVAGPNETTIETVSPNINKRAQDVVNALVDLIGYIDIEFDAEGNSTRTLLTRKTPYVVAGSRWPYLAPRIPFGYDNLVDAIGKAIDMQEKLDKAVVVDSDSENVVITKRPFEETQAEGRELWVSYVGDDPDKAEHIMLIVEQLFGKRLKLSEIKEKHQDLFEILIEEMKGLLD